MTTKPTTSDMTVAEIIKHVDHTKTPYNPDGNPFMPGNLSDAEALAAIEVHYAAKERADMEYVIGENVPCGGSEVIYSYSELCKRELQAEQRQRMAERLNNTEEQV